jgi:DNA gyrase subunit B
MSEEMPAPAEERSEDELRRAREASDDYTPENFQVLRDADHIRARPGMYIGDTGSHGLHHLVYELIYNSVDEALAGYCKHITVKVHVDESCSVSDDGRGIPVEMHPTEGKPVLEVAMTSVGAGGKFDKGAYKVSLGLHGMGLKAVNALSEWTEAVVHRGGRTYRQEYERGKATSEIKDIGPSKRTGTTIHFRADPEKFTDAKLSFDTLESRCRELCYLNKGLAIRLIDERSGKDVSFKYDGGIAEYVQYLAAEEKPLHSPPIYVDREMPGPNGSVIRVEVAMQYTEADDERCRAYTNNGFNPMGGTHLSGLRAALTRTMNAYGTKNELFNKVTPIGEDYRKGLTAVVSIQHPEPLFNAQTKEKLNNPEVEGAVSSAVSAHLSRYLEENPADAKKIMKKVILEAEAREAAAKAKQAIKERKGLLSGGGPDKLQDCISRDRDACELFLVEGDSAGGTATDGRNSMFQAILPLRGKPLNVEKARVESLLNNAEIKNLIWAVGLDLDVKMDAEDAEEALKKLKYGKIVLMSDADVDGQHIRTLLLTFFYRQMPLLVAQGRIYVARPPLFKVTEKKNVRFVQSNEQMQEELLARGLKSARLAIHPPGGGEPRMLAGAELESLVRIMDPLEGALQTLERRGVSLRSYLERATERGVPIYHVLVGGREEWCYTTEEADAIRQREAARLGGDPAAGEELAGAELLIQELHEAKKVTKGLRDVSAYGLGPADLLPQPRIAGREPPVRLRLESGEGGKVLPTLRVLVSEVRRIGEKGLSITRFKGLGEMDKDELWDTTLDPEKRQLLQVKLEDALKADELFRTLMGERVEPRKDFIYKHAIEAKDIDFHGA